MKRSNKGYSLVELLIVIAIMAILSGVAVVSVGLIKQARARDAVQSFNSQLTSAWLQTKAIGEKQDSMYMKVVRNGNQADFTISLYDGTTKKDLSGGTVDNNGHVTAETGNITLSKYITITYTPSDANQLESGYGNDKGTDGSGQWYIKFDKATGAVLKGAGKYVFTDTKGDLVSTVYLDAATGNHYIK